MARFISQYRAQKVTVFSAIDIETAIKRFNDGTRARESLIAEFEHGDVNDWEKLAMLDAELPIKGKGHDEDVTLRFSAYDTDVQAYLHDWTPEFKQEVEDRIRSTTSFGVDYIEVEKPKLPAPWPKYDSFDEPKIVAAVAQLGIDIEEVLAYERENENRPKVIAALEKLRDKPATTEGAPEPDPVVAA